MSEAQINHFILYYIFYLFNNILFNKEESFSKHVFYINFIL